MSFYTVERSRGTKCDLNVSDRGRSSGLGFGGGPIAVLSEVSGVQVKVVGNLGKSFHCFFARGFQRAIRLRRFDELMQSDQTRLLEPGAFAECRSMLRLNWVFRVVLSACEFMVFGGRDFWQVWEPVVFPGRARYQESM